jgi:2-C-methyl-D-erythritol 2,4-cyclodiphosphate synthase
MSLRIGIGVDAHRRVAGRPLVLGGVILPAEFGLEAHSDGDVLSHAILDALLGASGVGDKGQLFPPSDPQYKDIRSTLLLERAMSRLREQHYSLINVDVSVLCKEPKIAPHISDMKRELSQALGISPDCISVKGTTTERLGFTGRGEGIAAMAVVLLERAESVA